MRGRAAGQSSGLERRALYTLYPIPYTLYPKLFAPYPRPSMPGPSCPEAETLNPVCQECRGVLRDNLVDDPRPPIFITSIPKLQARIPKCGPAGPGVIVISWEADRV